MAGPGSGGTLPRTGRLCGWGDYVAMHFSGLGIMWLGGNLWGAICHLAIWLAETK